MVAIKRNDLTLYALIGAYLLAVVVANLLVVYFGPVVAVVNAFVLISLDLSSRDTLHERWQGKGLWPRMLALIAAGSLLSWWQNKDAGSIALASFVAFLAAGAVDTLVYSLLGSRAKLQKMNGSNLASSAVDSLVFPALAFGFPLLWWIVLGQFAAKVAGGFIWSLILTKADKAKSVIAYLLALW